MRRGIFHALLVTVTSLAFHVSLTQAEDKPAAVTPAEALTRLKDGNARYVAGKPATVDLVQRRTETAKEQKPFAIVLTCADSRLSPELLFNQGIGDVFVVRVAGNVTDPVVLGSIEYGVEHLGAACVVVLGHEKCGAVGAAVEGGHLEGNIAELVKRVHIGEKKAADKDAAIADGVRVNARYQAGEMTARSSVLKEFAESGRIQIVTGVYALDSGKIEWLAPPAKPEAAKPETTKPTEKPIVLVPATECIVVETICYPTRARVGLFGRLGCRR